MPEWRIYYTDGETFDSSQGSPADAPSRGVAVIVVVDREVGRGLLHRWDWYFWNTEDRQWYGCDQWGLIDHLLDNRATAVKMGRSVSQDRWHAILQRATNDPDFPRNNGSIRPLDKPGAVK